MKIKHAFSLATLVVAGALLGARESYAADVSIEVRGGDYYGRDYGRPVYYGHPVYREDYRVVSPPRERRERVRVEERREPERREPERREVPTPPHPRLPEPPHPHFP